jgi:saccharopine dehydrogenase (NAD+, L-lysine-forming)
MKIGVIREGKVPPDFRVPLTPKQCRTIETVYPSVKIKVQKSPIRIYKDEEYTAQGIEVVDDLNDCDLIIGVKEVRIEDLIPGKKFMFFSHTIKKQPYNRTLLQAIIDRKVELIDWETLRDKQNKRVIGFGRYAGIVGAYNGLRAIGLKTGLFELKKALDCHDRKEVELELRKVKLPSNYKIILTGYGRVGHGAREIIDLLDLKEVTPDEIVANDYDEPVFAHLELEDYYQSKEAKPFDKAEFYSNPERYKSNMKRFVSKVDFYIACHFWNNKAPFIITKEDLKEASEKNTLRLKVVADVSCDIDGPIACTIRPSKIADPFYGYHPQTGQEFDFNNDEAMMVMAVDNLPCELPRDASEDFGSEFIKYVLPNLVKEDTDDIIERAKMTNENGVLTPNFSYLQDYLDGK